MTNYQLYKSLLKSGVTKYLYQSNEKTSADKNQNIGSSITTPTELGGLAAAGGVASFAPASYHLNKIQVRDLMTNYRLGKNPSRKARMQATLDNPEYNANFIHDYIRGANNAFNTPLRAIKPYLDNAYNNKDIPYLAKVILTQGNLEEGTPHLQEIADHDLAFTKSPSTALKKWLDETNFHNNDELDQVKDHLQRWGVPLEQAAQDESYLNHNIPLATRINNKDQMVNKTIGRVLNENAEHHASVNKFLNEYQNHINSGHDEYKALKAMAHSQDPAVHNLMKKMVHNKMSSFKTNYNPIVQKANMVAAGGLGLAGLAGLAHNYLNRTNETTA